MTNTPVPLYQPLNTLKPVADNIWIADGGIIHMDMVVAKVPFSTRMAIVRLSDGGLWCHSPIAPDEQLFRQIDALGEVRHLVSPQLYPLRTHRRVEKALSAGNRMGQPQRSRTCRKAEDCRLLR